MSVDMGYAGTITMDSDERCKHELIKQHCGYCRTPPVPQFMEALFDTPGDRDAIGHPFPAQYAGRCEGCDGFFETGDMICHTEDGTYICTDCAT